MLVKYKINVQVIFFSGRINNLKVTICHCVRSVVVVMMMMIITIILITPEKHHSGTVSYGGT
jgi:hypothetical protein